MSRIADEHELLTPVQTRLPSVRRVLAFAPHPDDEIFGCGGLLRLLHEQGADVQVVIVTDGARGGDGPAAELTSLRAAESRAAAQQLGLPEPIFWGYPDRGLAYNEQLIARLGETITDWHADLVVLPSPTELHPDHQVLALAGSEALRRLEGERQVAYFEINAPLADPTLVVDISSVFEEKKHAMACFPSQLREQPYIERIAGLNSFRSYFLGPQAVAAEAYLLVETRELAPGLARLFEGPFPCRRQSGFAVDSTDLPLVSVIVRSMDRPTLSRALGSLALQTWPNVEIVIVNAAGAQHSPLPHQCGPFTLRLVNQGGEALGRSRAANLGLAACRGQFIGFLDDDDTVDPDHLHSLVDALLSADLEQVAYTGVRAVDENAQQPTLFEFRQPGVDFSRLLLGNIIPIHAPLFPASLVSQEVSFDETLDLYEDWDFWLQLSRKVSFVFVDRVSATYYAGGASAVGLGAESDSVIRQLASQKVLSKWLPWLTPQELAAIGELYHHDISQAVTALAEKDRQISEKDRQISEKDRQISEKDRQISEKDRQIDDVQQRLIAKEEHLSQVYASRSWKMTGPLRCCAGWLTRPPLSTPLRKAISAWRYIIHKAPVRRWKCLVARQHHQSQQSAYTHWISSHEIVNDPQRNTLREQLQHFDKTPLISVIMPTYNAKVEWLTEAIASVRSQLYPAWELCIADDASTDPAIRPLLERAAAEDMRIKVVFRQQNGHIAAASNSALELASGDYIALLDHDDLLAELALFRVVEALQHQPDAGMLYSDEDMLDEQGTRCCPFFKPDWSPHLAISQAYLGHLVVLRRDVMQKTGGFQSGLDGAQDYDLWLRASRFAGVIVHIPHVLYHWRRHADSTAATATAKPYAHEAGRKAVAQYLQLRYPSCRAEVVDGEYLFTYQARFQLPHPFSVSIIIPTRDGLEFLQPCIESIIERSSWQHFEIIVLDNGSRYPETLSYLHAIATDDERIRVVRADIPFNWSQLNNIGAAQSRGDLLVFLNNDTLVIRHDWLERLAGYALLPDVGVVGGLLLFEDGTIQHSGVVVGMGGWADHPFRGCPAVHGASPFVSPMLTRNVLSVTGACMAVSRERFGQLGGFDESFTICGSDVELGLRAHQKGFFNVMCAEAQLYHLESKTRSSFVPEADFLQSAAKYEPYRTRQPDPFYNPNLSLVDTTPKVRV
ncbi:MAG: glycosyltransferase [Desulfuromonadaceae bacterium]|nr:glycosyltransferase [Desulfuromonadaceae bacterium]